MPTRATGSRTELAKVVEKQMRNWELARTQRPQPQPAEPPPEVAAFVAISRTVASGGSQVATLLGERLGWPVFDREILQAMAGDDRVRTQLYEQLDEHDVNWLEATARWLIQGELRQDDYFHRLTETVLALARQGHAVFLGRGADLILPRNRGLRVRVTAVPGRRAERLAERGQMTSALASAEVERLDRERGEFRRHHFGPTANEVCRHDLVLNMDQFTHEQAVELILLAMRQRGLLA
jgi:cytidylate kinase